MNYVVFIGIKTLEPYKIYFRSKLHKFNNENKNKQLSNSRTNFLVLYWGK